MSEVIITTQCEHIIEHTGKRCLRQKVPGLDVCATHRQRDGKRRPRFYKRLTRSLQTMVEEQLAEDISDQLNLFEELALMRVMCAEIVEMYSKATEKRDPNIQAQATQLLISALNEVKEMCKSAAAVEGLRKDAISPLQLKAVVNKLVGMLYEVCGNKNRDIAKQFEKLVEEELAVQGDATGTDLKPSDDVQDMINTIPKLEVNDDASTG